MKNEEFWSMKLYPKLISVYPEFKEWMKKDVLEIKKFLKKEFVVLDVGCGWGREIKELAPFCKRIVGVDDDPKEVETAKSYLKDIPNIVLLIRNAQKIDFPDESFDIIISLGNTLGNLRESKEIVLREMKRLVDKDGKILISVYLKGNTFERAEAYKKIGLKIREIKDGKIIFEGGEASEEFSKNELKKLFEKVGLKVKFKDINSIAVLCIAERIK